MIAKIGKGENLIGALSYNQQKVDKDKGAVLLSSKIAEPLDGHYTVAHINRYFEPYLVANRNTEKVVRHISLNPDPNDKVTDDQFRIMAQQYMEKMGYGNQPFVVYKHNDIDRTHIHIVTICVDLDGNKISDSHDHPRSMAICREMERKFSLIPATDKSQTDSVKKFRPVNYKEGDIKSQLASVVRYLPRYYNFQSLGAYNALLSLFNITAEKVSGEVNGVKKSGLVYFALNENGEKAGTPFKASKFGGHATLKSLEKHFTASAEHLKNSDVKKRLKHDIELILNTSTHEQGFKKSMVSNGINAVIRRNETGRIYGITFIDHESRSVWNGSQLGKNLSANVFNDLWTIGEINRTNEIAKNTDIPQRNGKGPSDTDDQVHSMFNFLNGSNSSHFEYSGFLDGLSGIIPDNQAEDFEEIDFENRMKKRKKKVRRRPK